MHDGQSVDERISDPEKWGMNDAQRESLLSIYADFPAPMVVGWIGDSPLNARKPGGWVEVRLYRSVDDDEQGRHCGEASIYRSGEIQWWTRP